MAYEQKDNSGALFKNTDKREDTHADYAGSIMVDGKSYWLNAWLKTSKAGAKYLSLAVKPKGAPAKVDARIKSREESPDAFDLSDEIPF